MSMSSPRKKEERSMTKQHNIQASDTSTMEVPSAWQQAYLAGTGTVGASWLNFMGERFHAYAHVIDDISHCHDLNEAWRIQSAFGQETARAYGEQAAKLSSMVLKAANGDIDKPAT
jgi:hypothetical protein